MRKFIAATLICTLINQPAVACLWDYDTLAMERREFPGSLELITGKFLRHSPEYYQWRIEDRQQKLETDPENLKLLDDLAVAYDKIGEHEKAIEIATSSKVLNPNRYETAANLGTFHIHAGQFEQGLIEIKRALSINPDAHFGREEYQQLLVEYLLERKSIEDSGDHKATRLMTFPKFIVEKKFPNNKKSSSSVISKEISAATKGVLGMMRFGNYDSPILLESLGELLTCVGDSGSASHRLGCRAFLKAAYESTSPEEQQRLRKKAESSLGYQTPQPNVERFLKISDLEATFKTELSEAQQWYGQVTTDEQQWLQDGKDLDAEFSAKYYEEPALIEQRTNGTMKYLLLLGLALIPIVALVLRKRHLQTNQNQTPTEPAAV